MSPLRPIATRAGVTAEGASSQPRVSLFATVSVFLVLAIWLGTLDLRELMPSDEGRYAQIAREMAATGDWVTIRYNGLKYFEKPPFHLWMSALAFEVFGVGAWQARLWGALGGLFTIAIMMAAAARWWRAAGHAWCWREYARVPVGACFLDVMGGAG